MKRLFCLCMLVLIYSIPTVAQSLGRERVTRLKNCIVKVLIEGKISGTGFIVAANGTVITCWHVVEPALIKRLKTEIEYPNGERVEALIPNYLLKDGLREAIGFDCLILMPSKLPKIQLNYLKVGAFNDIDEGDQVYTCGYPLAIQQPVITMGIVSTKWTQTSLFTFMGKRDSVQRNVAWLDLTMNRGNSGGPIIKLGNTPQDDSVVGIATFVLNPYGPLAEQLASAVSNSTVDINMNGVSQNKQTQLFAEAIANNSIGVSGCISIDHVINLAKRIK